jgi:hypothetical protein
MQLSRQATENLPIAGKGATTLIYATDYSVFIVRSGGRQLTEGL